MNLEHIHILFINNFQQFIFTFVLQKQIVRSFLFWFNSLRNTTSNLLQIYYKDFIQMTGQVYVIKCL